VDLLPKTALVQEARRLADVPSRAMLIYKQQPCSSSNDSRAEEEATKEVKSPGASSSGRTRAFFRAGLSFTIEASGRKGRLRPFAPGSSESEIDHIRPREENGGKHVFFTPRVLQDAAINRVASS
jgi:hypothetical protein